MSVYVDTSNLDRTPRWSPLQAVNYGLREVQNPDQWYENQCDHYVTWCYGYAGSGYYNAQAHFNSIPMRFRHQGTDAPRGALVFWMIGANGHVALAVGGRRCVSTDIIRLGKPDVVPIDFITQRWGARYLGWTQPVVDKCWGLNPNTPRDPALHPTRLHAGVMPGHEHLQVPDVKKVMGRWMRMRGHDNPWAGQRRTTLYGTALRNAVTRYHHSTDGQPYSTGPNDDSIGPAGWEHVQHLIGRQ